MSAGNTEGRATLSLAEETMALRTNFIWSIGLVDYALADINRVNPV